MAVTDTQRLVFIVIGSLDSVRHPTEHNRSGIQRLDIPGTSYQLTGQPRHLVL